LFYFFIIILFGTENRIYVFFINIGSFIHQYNKYCGSLENYHSKICLITSAIAIVEHNFGISPVKCQSIVCSCKAEKKKKLLYLSLSSSTSKNDQSTPLILYFFICSRIRKKEGYFEQFL
jgi:hypothetical protein